MPKDIILIGPARAGKTTIGRILGDRLGIPNVSLDEVRWGYYREVGYNDQLAKEIRQKGGFLALAFFWQNFDRHAVRRVLEEHHNCVFDFGAGASVYENTETFAAVKVMLADYPNVVLILPSRDPEESIRVLNERTKDLVGTYGQGFNWNEYFVRHRCNYELARTIVYTEGMTPEETAKELLAKIDWSD